MAALAGVVLLLAMPVYATPGVFITDFYVTPRQATAGTRVTAGVTVRNLDSANPVSVTITISDGGIIVATSKPVSIPASGSGSVQFQFKTATSASHCYLATTSPVVYSIGYCEVGNLLSGTQLAVNGLFAVAPYFATAVGAGAIGLVLVSRRAKKKEQKNQGEERSNVHSGGKAS